MRMIGHLIASGTLLLGLAIPGKSQTVSTSKLSVHLDFHYSAGARQIVAAGPQVLKILDLGGEMLAAVRDYKAAYPDGLTVLRIYTRVSYRLQDDPEASAQDFWNRVLWPPLAHLSDDDRQLIDYLEGPNEGDSTPTWGSVESALWFGRFWAVLAPLMQDNGFRPCVGSIPVGNPPGTVQEMEDQLEAFTPALYAALDGGGAWSYHAYSDEYTTDENTESWYSLRYRRFYDFLGRQHPELTSLPLILTEGGAGRDGWRSGGAERFENWLTWFDGEISQDDYVLGVTLFEIGDPRGWPSFDLEPVADWLATYLGKH
ncbi:MAG TPA: hypothetical protein VGY77_02030 [Gemmataceae bacterium]|jgi:hypothetical protein|nr:hypothetical protein [Gemmataceae bacterium]